MSENKDNKFFSISLYVVSKHGPLIKLYKNYYLKMLFEDFVKKFDISDDNQIELLSLLSHFINDLNFKVNDKDKYGGLNIKSKL